jgi:PAS domain S-box-containing protein
MNTTHPAKILVVDDTSTNLQVLTNLLEEHGYTVYPASDGELALEFVRSTLPDLILLDIRMPGMDGYEVCRRLKADERTRVIPVIFISILEDEHDKVKGFRAGAVDYITKPFQAEEVVARVRIHLQLRELTEQLEHKVAERTEAFRDANARLQRELKQRQRTEEELAGYRDHLEELVQARTAELEAARNRARQYLDIAGVILVAIDADRRVTLINQKGCEVLQGTATEIIGKDWFETFVPEQIRRDVVDGFQQLMAGELEPMEYFENPVLTQSGEKRLVAWHNALLKDDKGRITGTLSSGEDITEKKHAEEQIINLNQDLQKRAASLEAANKELEGFTYSVSHDLRAPLRHIHSFLELLQKLVGNTLDEQCWHYMDNISEAAQKMGRLIDELLSFSRMGRYALSIRKVDLAELVRDILREFEPDTAGRNIDWRIGDLPVVSGDGSMLRTVLVSLISNALKFTLLRETARIEIGSIAGQASEAVIFVRDNGVGFDMAYADKLFGVFQRLHREEEFEGTGIGLANVRRIIARHGGRVWAEGESGRGAAFFFSLPKAIQGA